MNLTETISIPANEVSDLQSILDIKDGRDPKSGDTIKTFTADFGNGIQSDIKVCNGNTPFVDAVLFDGDVEVGLLEPDDTLLGEYIFYYNGDTYTVIVKEK